MLAACGLDSRARPERWRWVLVNHPLTPEHLAYSTLVHPGDTWAEMRDSLKAYAPAVKERVSPAAPYAVSLRLSGASAQTLTNDHAERAALRAWLDEHDMYVYTVNAFPHGPFKGRTVMEDVYEPDWSDRGPGALHLPGRRHPRRDHARPTSHRRSRARRSPSGPR